MGPGRRGARAAWGCRRMWLRSGDTAAGRAARTVHIGGEADANTDMNLSSPPGLIPGLGFSASCTRRQAEPRWVCHAAPSQQTDVTDLVYHRGHVELGAANAPEELPSLSGMRHEQLLGLLQGHGGRGRGGLLGCCSWLRCRSFHPAIYTRARGCVPCPPSLAPPWFRHV